MQKTRVSVANLKNATQAKQRREKHCEAMVKQAVAKAKLEGVDDAKAIVMEFEGLRPMWLVFDEGKMESCPEEKDQAEDELDENNSVATNDDDVKQRVKLRKPSSRSLIAKALRWLRFENSIVVWKEQTNSKWASVSAPEMLWTMNKWWKLPLKTYLKAK